MSLGPLVRRRRGSTADARSMVVVLVYVCVCAFVFPLDIGRIRGGEEGLRDVKIGVGG